MSLRSRRPHHLPFLTGTPTFAPDLNPIPVSEWLSPDREAETWLRDKNLILKMMRANVVGGDLNGAAAEELLALMVKELGEVPDQSLPTALEEAASLVSDDLCLLSSARPHDWRLVAGVLCAPTYWTLPERIGLDLAALHGPVPGGDPALAARIGRIFSGLEPGTVLERFNWTVQTSDKRYTPDRPLVSGKTETDLHLRVERQTLRKLPQTNTVTFSIRVSVDPLLPILADDRSREAFEDAWLGAPARVRRYKHWDELETLVASACRSCGR